MFKKSTKKNFTGSLVKNLKINFQLLGSEVTQAIKMMKNAQEINAIILDPINAKNHPFLIFPINNNDQDAAGGSHWSLCVFSKSDNTFYHFDSSRYFNHQPCEQLVNIIKKCLQIPSAEFQHVDCLQQNNSYDCGIYVLCHADLVCKTIMKSKSLKDIKKLNCKLVTTKRSELIEIIKNLKT